MPPVSFEHAGKLPVIDALRGLAILGVITVHAHEAFPPASRLLRSLAAQGGWGVQLFFILSALTLLISWHSRHEPAAAPRFLVRRFFRVAPLFYAAIGLYAWHYGFQPRYYAPQGIGPWDYLSTFLFLHGWRLESINSIVPGGWSIADEFNFYLLFPFLVSLLTNLKRSLGALVVCAALAALSTGFLWHTWHALNPAGHSELLNAFLMWWLPAQMPVFLIGFVLYFLILARAPERLRARLISSHALGRGLVALSLLAAFLMAFLPLRGLAYPFYALDFGLGIWGLFLAPWKPLCNRVLVHVGKVSYSAYFIHFMVISWLGFMRPLLPPSDLGFLLFCFSALGLTVLISTFTYTWIEKPGIQWGRRIASRLGAGKLALAPSSISSGSA